MRGKTSAPGDRGVGSGELLERVPVGVALIDAAGQALYVNHHWCQLTGLTKEQASGVGWHDALHTDDRERVLERCRTVPASQDEVAEEFRLQAPDGTVRSVSTRAVPRFDAKGRFHGYLCAVADITEREESEQKLRTLLKELNCLFEVSDIIERAAGSLEIILRETVYLLPKSWQYSDIACARIVMGELEFHTENCAPTEWKQTAEIVVRHEKVGTVEVGYLKKRPDRDEGPFVAEERRLIDAVAERLGRVAERLRAEQQFEEREQELRQRLTHLTRVSVMGEMASSIAHEVNQPLTAVATYAQACRRMVDAGMSDSALVTDALERISDEALRAGEIIHRLRELVQKRESERSESDINELIRGIENLASVDARLHDVRIIFDLARDLPPARVDGVQIQQVVLNLLRNAIDAAIESDDAHKEVVVMTRRVDGEIQVSVTDYGHGLPAEAEQRLFQPFFTTKKGGIGMGLSVSRSIVTAHDGLMWFSRNPERGTTFFFTIPSCEIEADHNDAK